MSERLQKLQAMLATSPADPFLLYAAGMEYKKMGDHLRAVEYFRRTIAADPKYCYAYFQAGQTYELADNPAAAKQAYKDGIAAAQMAGDAHAQSEIQAALDMMD
jgi:tetratricopeptide (TPR) repeat protein